MPCCLCCSRNNEEGESRATKPDETGKNALSQEGKPKVEVAVMSKSIKNEALNAHNEYRAKHGAPALKWSSKLASNAQKWAETLAKRGVMQHASQKEEGENIACMKGQDLTGRKATDMWYEEIKDYSFSNPGFSSRTGHFTQVVWAGSRELGVGKATAASGMQFVVARYFPPGNMLGDFPDNVKRSGSKPGKVSKPPKERATASPRAGGSGGGSRGKKEDKPAKPQNSGQFKKDIVKSHNRYRKMHSVPGLKWSSKLASEAQRAAEDAARTNTLRPVQMDNVGQNMAAMTGGELTGEKVTSMWYEEEKNYRYNSPGFSSSTGSFTQMVWAESKTFGAGKAVGSGGQQFVVALYQPPGNVRSHYDTNIKPPSGKGGSDKKSCAIM